MLNVIHLRTLRECVRTRSFAAAGRTLGYTTSAVSRQMTVLERAVGTPLFERHAHSVRSTKAAETLAARSGPVLDALAMLDQGACRTADQPAQTLDLGFCPSVQSWVLSAATAQLIADHPDLDVRLHRASHATLVRDLLAEKLDAALVVENAATPVDAAPELRRQPLLREPLLLALPHDHRLHAHTKVDAGDLRTETWIAAEPGSTEAQALDALAAEAGFVPQVVCRSNDHEVIADLVRRGSGIALLPPLPAPADGLISRPLAGQPSTRTLTVLTNPKAAGSPLLDPVIDLLTPTNQP